MSDTSRTWSIVARGRLATVVTGVILSAVVWLSMLCVPGAHAQAGFVLNIGHSSVVTRIVFSADATLMASGSDQGQILVWAVPEFKLLRQLSRENAPHAHSGGITHLAFTRDGSRLFSSSDGEPIVRVWETGTGRLAREVAVRSAGGVEHFAILPDGERLALPGGPDGGITLWDVARGTPWRTIGSGIDAGAKLHVAAGGDRIVSYDGNGKGRSWSVTRGVALGPVWQGHEPGPYWPVAVSADGTLVASSGGEDAAVWAGEDGRVVRKLRPNAWALGFSADGRHLMGLVKKEKSAETESGEGVDWQIARWSVTAGESEAGPQLVDLARPDIDRYWFGLGSILSLARAISPDGGWVAMAAGSEILAWNAARPGAPPVALGRGGGNEATTFSPDLTSAYRLRSRTSAENAASSAASKPSLVTRYLVERFDLAAGRRDARDMPVPWTGDGSADQRAGHWALLRALDPAIGAPPGPSSPGAGDRLPDARQLVLATSAGIAASVNPEHGVDLWSTVTWRPQGTLTVGRARFGAMRIAPDGRHLVAAQAGSFLDSVRLAFGGDGAPGRLAIFRIEGRQHLATVEAHKAQIRDIGFSGDGRRFATLSHAGEVKVFDLTGALIGELPAPGGKVTRTALALDTGGGRVAVATGATTEIYDVADPGKRSAVVHDGHSGAVEAIGFDPSGRTVVTTGADGAIMVWDAASGRTRATYRSDPSGAWIAITPEGFFDWSGEDAAGLLSIVRGHALVPVDRIRAAFHRPDLVRESLAGDPEGKVRRAAQRHPLDEVVSSGSAPLVEIVSPRPGQRPDERRVRFDVRITDTGGGIGRIEWRVNGPTQVARALSESAGAGDGWRLPGMPASANVCAERGCVVTRTQTFELPFEQNTIEVAAYNKADRIASEPSVIVVEVDKAVLSETPDLHVLTVAVDRYEADSKLDLTYAISDAQAVARALETAGQGYYGKVHLAPPLLGKDVTRPNLDKAFAELASRVRARDTFIFYIAGHGKTVDGQYFFLPADFKPDASGAIGEKAITERGIGQDAWQAWFAAVKAQRSVLLYDTCESGILAERRRGGLENRTAIERMKQATGRNVFTAALRTGAAYEGYRGHGIFTYALLEAIALGDRDGSGFIGTTELKAYLDERVPEIAEQELDARQVPAIALETRTYDIVRAYEGAMPAASKGRRYPARATHAAIDALMLRAGPAETAAGTVHLERGTMVHVPREGEAGVAPGWVPGWVKVARDGVFVGYAPASRLLELRR